MRIKPQEMTIRYHRNYSKNTYKLQYLTYEVKLDIIHSLALKEGERRVLKNTFQRTKGKVLPKKGRQE
jgi:hypothetical protein